MDCNNFHIDYIVKNKIITDYSIFSIISIKAQVKLSANIYENMILKSKLIIINLYFRFITSEIRNNKRINLK